MIPLDLEGDPLDDSDDRPDDGLWDHEGGHYCEHGTYLGTPGGADLMCGRCEMEGFE